MANLSKALAGHKEYMNELYGNSKDEVLVSVADSWRARLYRWRWLSPETHAPQTSYEFYPPSY